MAFLRGRIRLNPISRCQINGLSFCARVRIVVASQLNPYSYRFWYIKLYALTESKDFDGLDVFAKSKRSPIGYDPFVHHLVEKGYSKEAATYVAKCYPSKRADLYVKCGDWRSAARECKERNDKAKLEFVVFPRYCSKTYNVIQTTEVKMSKLHDYSRIGSSLSHYEVAF